MTQRLRDARILDTVVQILETQGYDAVQLREVARRSQTSLTTIYKRYSNRDELIAAAVQIVDGRAPIREAGRASATSRANRSTPA